MFTTAEHPQQEILQIVDDLRRGQDSDANMFKLLGHCRKWNSAGGPGNAALAMMVFRAVFTRWRPKRPRADRSLDERSLVEAIDAHCMKYFERISNLGARARILDYIIEAAQR